MDLEAIYRPINNELSLFREKIRAQINRKNPAGNYSDNVIDYFSQSQGKLLRPALVLLSAKAVAGEKELDNQALIKMAISVEFIHNASLIHDDIIDESAVRREQAALHRQFGNKIAVLTADVLFAKAFALMVETRETAMIHDIALCVEAMCKSEIRQQEKPFSTFDAYINLIHDKTARFMSLCCRSGALIAEAESKIACALAEFGLNFGLTYQLVDDLMDGDMRLVSPNTLKKEAIAFQTKAIQSLSLLSDSVFKQSLEALTHYIILKN